MNSDEIGRVEDMISRNLNRASTDALAAHVEEAIPVLARIAAMLERIESKLDSVLKEPS